MTSLNESEIRKTILRNRSSLLPASVREKSGQAVARFLKAFEALGGSDKAYNIGMYSALPSELSLIDLEPTLIQWGCKLFFPKVMRSSPLEPFEEGANYLEFVEVIDPIRSETNWKQGPYGIQEPSSLSQALDPVDLDIVFVPGVAFGEKGERIGMGKGYYDRFLPQAPNALRVALAFDFQVLPSLVQKSTDQPVHWICTEERNIQLPSVDQWLCENQKVKKSDV